MQQVHTIGVGGPATLIPDVQRMGRLVLDQLRRAITCFNTLDLEEAEEIIERDDVIDNLNILLEERCFDLAATGQLGREELRAVRATAKAVLNLERAGDAATHVAKRVRLIHHEGLQPVPFACEDLQQLAVLALEEAATAFLERDLDLARQACLREPALDSYYVAHLEHLRRRLAESPDAVPYLLHVSSVLKYLEKIADYTLNIGEQAIFLITGRRLKFSQFQQLDRLIGDRPAGAVEFRPFWDGISGAIVARVSGDELPVIYKEGSRRKIQSETEKLQEWQQIAHGLTPRVLASITVEDRQALLREFVDGTLLSDLYVSDAPTETKLHATRRLIECIEAVWRSTLRTPAPDVNYAGQIRRRLHDVFALHPQLQEMAASHVGAGSRARSLHDLLTTVDGIQASLASPFAVWLHGDFNANNVVYQPSTRHIQFIDVHRSQYGDYVQDIGVFLMSMDRRPDLNAAARADVRAVNDVVEAFARRFGQEQGDRTFERRLTLCLARSSITSCRVVIDAQTAEQLFRRGLALLEAVVDAW